MRAFVLSGGGNRGVRSRSVIDAALQAIAVMGRARAQAELACPPAPALLHHVALPCRADRWFTDFSATPDLLAEGAATARTYLGRQPGNVVEETDLPAEHFYEKVEEPAAGPSAAGEDSEASR